MFGDEIIPSQTSARNFCSAVSINNLHWRWSRESAETLYGSYKNFNGDVPIKNVDDILCETIQDVNKEHIGVSYRAAYRKFVTEILKEVPLKDLYSHEINFKGKVGDTDRIYRILPLPSRGGNERRKKNFPNAVFVTIFFPTTVSDTAVRKAFLELGEVHDGKLKKSYNNISNKNRHIRMTPYKTKQDLPHEKLFDDSLAFELRRKYNAKSVCTHGVILATQLQILYKWGQSVSW